MPDNAQTWLAEARQAVADKDFERAREQYKRLISTSFEAEGYYGLGFLSMSRPDEATSHFERALTFDPNHANSLYQLGVLAERDGRMDAAIVNYRTAISRQRDHGGAFNALRRLNLISPAGAAPGDGPPRLSGYSPRPSGSASSSAPRSIERDFERDQEGPWDGDVDDRFGVYEYLLNEQALLSRQAVDVISRLRINRSPTIASFFGFAGPRKVLTWRNALLAISAVLLLPILIVVVLGAFQAITVSGNPGAQPDFGGNIRRTQTGFLGVLRGAVSVLWLGLVLFVVWRFILHITTRIRVERGRLQIDRGLLVRNRSSLELWRVQNVELEHRGFHRLTGDGVLIFHHGPGQPPIEVPGMARGQGLIELQRDLLDLVFLLRTNPSIKGIVQ